MNVFKVDSWWLKPFLTQTSHWLKPKLICLDFFVLFLISWKVSVWFRFLWFNYSCLWLEPFSISIEGLSYWEWTEQFIFCISAHSNALSYTKETINKTSPSGKALVDLTILVHLCLTLFSSQDLNVNPLTPKIWLLILPSSCYIFP